MSLAPVRSAEISADGAYRYVLNRRWAPDGPVMAWIGLNPSTADASTDDATIRRMCGFARREGCRGICVLNLYALRATDPAALLVHPDPVGPDNDKWLANVFANADGPVVAAWGTFRTPRWSARGVRAAARVSAVLAVLGEGRLQCLGTNRDGSPRHPVRLAGDTPLEAWAP